MLKQRIASGLVLAAFILVAVIFLRNSWLALALAIIYVPAAREWARLTSLQSSANRWEYVVVAVVFCISLWVVRDSVFAMLWLLAAVVVWMLVLVLLANYRQEAGQPPRWQPTLGVLGLLLLTAAWLAFVKLHAIHYAWLLYIMILCGVADSMAYFAGKRFGRSKLAPELSPGKTREGMLGGLIGVLVFALGFGLWWGFSAPQLVSFLLLSLLTGLVSVEGDLFESLIKREVGVKDSGWILPGHGGMLDRFDSHIAAAPVFYIGLNWIL